MSRLRYVLPLLLGLLAGLALTLSGSAEEERSIQIRFSRFQPELITVTAGQPVTFVLQNNDPIEHEWLVGPEPFHELHRFGAEAAHDEVPTEVTIPALTTKRTTVTFETPGEYAFICHLPGHEAYGMRGTVRVLPK